MLAIAVPVLLPACGSDHHVSPWGKAGPPTLAALVEPADLDRQLALIDAEVAAHRLTLVSELSVVLPRGGGPARIRGYEGVDTLGRRTHAVRVATVRMVAMAVGPLDASDPARNQATELVLALIPGEAGDEKGGAYRSGTDLNGDGELDVVLRSERGALEIWRLTPLGANLYDVALEATPTRAIEADGDGYLDLAGDAPVDPGDPIAPRFTDVATFDGARYSNQTPAARAFHARLTRAVRPRQSDAERLRDALERAWHAVLAGDKSPEAARKDLDREAAPKDLRQAFDRHVARIEAIKPRRKIPRPAP